MNDEIGWLIERYQHSVLHYWTGDKDHWSMDSIGAVRFSRREDAEKMLSWYFDGKGKVAEHMWVQK